MTEQQRFLQDVGTLCARFNIHGDDPADRLARLMETLDKVQRMTVGDLLYLMQGDD